MAERQRVALRLHPDTYQRVQYWAQSRGLSTNEWLSDAIEGAIARENGDYDLPTLEIARLSQLIDEIKALSTNSANLERMIVTMSESLIGLARGDNYLLDRDEDGELQS